jgi:ABC-2 type transport system ATP-binding protein
MNVIEVTQLTKEFDKKQVLKGADFVVQKGEVFGFLGPNGAGKTTTMRIILGLLKPTSGQALVWQEPLEKNRELRKRVGVLLEEEGLYPRISAQENLEYFARLYEVDGADKRISETLELVGLKGQEKEKVGYYSKGMKRRLGLARAILHRPEILLMDEPSSGLDPEAQKLVRDLILELSRAKGVTIFLNSHDLDEVQRICSRVAILQRGEIKALDTIKNLTSARKQEISITFPDADGAEKAMEMTRALNYVAERRRAGNTMTVGLKEGGDTSALLESLLGKGLRVEEVKKLGRSLEDIYLEAVRQEDMQ